MNDSEVHQKNKRRNKLKQALRYTTLTHDEMQAQRSVKCKHLNRRKGLGEVVREVAVRRQTSEKSKPDDIGVAENRLGKY